jgi:hypothetical protein
MVAARELSVLLSVCLVASAAGCTSAERWAVSSHERIVPGMTADEVRDEIGEPVQIVRGDPGQPEVWVYQFTTGPGTIATVLLVILLIGLIVLVVAAGGGGGANFGGGGGSEAPAEFRVTFDGKGTVVEVSPVFVIVRD